MSDAVEYVRNACKSKGITVSKLEKDLGYSNGYFNPKKLKKVPYDRAVEISNYLNIDIRPILGEESDESSASNVSVIDKEVLEYLDELRNRPEMRMLFSVSRDATKEDIEKAVKIIEALKDN